METTFAKLLDENLDTLNFEIGKLITGVVVDLTDDWVVIHVGLKSEPVSYTHLRAHETN